MVRSVTVGCVAALFVLKRTRYMSYYREKALVSEQVLLQTPLALNIAHITQCTALRHRDADALHDAWRLLYAIIMIALLDAIMMAGS